MYFSPPAELFGEQGLIVLLVVAIVLFGSTQIPKLARSLGSAQKEFKKGLVGSAPDTDKNQTVVVGRASPTVLTEPAQTEVIVEATAAASPGTRPS